MNLQIKKRGDFLINEKNKIEELDGFKLINIFENTKEKDEEIKIFNTLEMIDYCLRNNVKSMMFQSIQSTNGNGFHCLYFDCTGKLTNPISKEDLDNKYAVKIEKPKFSNALGAKFKEGSLWVRNKSSEGVSPATTLERTIQWIIDEPGLSDIYEIYHKNDEGHEKVLAERIK